MIGPPADLPEVHECPICTEVVSGATYEGPNCTKDANNRVTHSMHRDCAISYVQDRKIDAEPGKLAETVVCPLCAKSLYKTDASGRIVEDEFLDPPGLEALRANARARKRAAEAREGEETARRLARTH